MAHERERHQTQSNFIAKQTHRASEPALQILSYITQTEYLLVESYIEVKETLEVKSTQFSSIIMFSGEDFL